MIEIAIVAFTTVFAAVGPVEVALLLPAITRHARTFAGSGQFSARCAWRQGPPVVIAHPEPWASLAPDFGAEPAALIMVESLERAYLDGLVRDLPPVLSVEVQTL